MHIDSAHGNMRAEYCHPAALQKRAGAWQRVSMMSSFMLCYRRAKLQHITLASCLSISSRPMRIRFQLAPLLPLLPQLGLAPATLINSKVQVTSSHLAVATLGQAAVVEVVEVLAAVVGDKELAAVVEVVMVLAGAIKAGVVEAQLRVRHRGVVTSSRLSSSRGSRQVRLSLQAAGQQPTTDMCGTCLSGCQQPPWHCLLQPWGTSTCNSPVRPIPPVLHRSCRSALCHSLHANLLTAL